MAMKRRIVVQLCDEILPVRPFHRCTENFIRSHEFDKKYFKILLNIKIFQIKFMVMKRKILDASGHWPWTIENPMPG